MAIPFLSPVNTTADIRLPASGKLFLWTGHDSNFLQYNLWHASASGGMFIKNIASSGDIYFQTNSTTALTLDSSQKANFTGDVVSEAFTGKLQGSITGAPDQTIWRVSGQYTNWGIFYNEGSPDKIEFKAGGTVTSTIALDNGDATFNNVHSGGRVRIQGGTDNGSQLNLFCDSDGDAHLAAYTFAINTGSNSSRTESLKIDNNKNATFAGDVTIGALTSGETAQLVVNQEGGVAPVAKFMSRTNKAIVQVSDNDTTGYISSENGLFSLGRNAGVNANNINVDSSNRVGIGASNVQEKLHVYNAGTARIEIEGTTGPAAFKATNNQGSFGWYVPSNANEFRLWNFGTSADLVTVNASGAVTAATGFIADAVSASNNDPGTDNVQFSGYGMIGNRGNLYITNASTDSAATVQIGVGGVHNGSPKLKIGSSTSHILTNLLPGSDSTYNIGSNASRFSNIYADTLHGTVALSSEASNLGSFDDRDMAPEDMSFSDDLKLFFVEKSGIEGGTVGSNWQDALFISSYVDASGGNPNLLAFDKSEKKIYHYQASATATSWGTPKELAYTDSVLNLSGGTLQGNIVMGDNDITGIDELVWTSGTKLRDNSTNYLQLNYASGGAGGILILDGDNTTQGYIYADGQATSSFGFLDGSGSWAVRCVEDQYVELRYDNSVKFRTASAGVTITGTMQATNDVVGAGDLSIRNVKLNQGNSPTITLGVINSSTGNSKIQFYSKNSGSGNGYALQYNKDTNIDRLEFIDGSGTANIKFNNGGAAEFAGSVTATQINTGQGATEVHLMNQNLRTTDDVTFDDLTVTGNLTITGDINSYNVTDLDITDKTITLGKGQDEGHSGGSGLIVDGSSASILWDESNDTWDFNKGIYITGNDGNVNLDGNAAIIFDNTNNNNGWYIRNGGSNAATLQFGLGTSPGSNIKHTFAGDGSVTFATYVNAATGFRMASGQAIDFIDSNIGYNSIERNTTVGGLQINTGGNSSMNLLDNGNVGVGGANNPGGKFQVDDYTVGSNGSQSVFGNISSFSNSGSENLFLGIKNASYPNRGWAFNPVSSGVNSDLVIKEHGSTAERMRIKSGGNVGIGYDNPYKKLHLHNPTDSGTPDCQMNFTTGVTEAGDGNGFRVGWNGTVANMYLFENADMRFATNNSERMRIKADGKVGIGTTTPLSKLHIDSTEAAVHFTRSGQETYRIIHGSSGLYFSKPNSGGLAFGVTQNSDFDTFDSSGNTLFRSDASTGRIGIGVTDIKKSLEIEINNSNNVITTGNSLLGGDSGAGVLIRNSNTTTNSYANLDFRANNADGRIAYQYTGTANQGDFHFVVDNTSNAKSAMVIKNDGKVGIGSTAPTNPLHVKNGDSSGGNTYSLIKVENGTNHAEYGALSGYARIRASGNEIMAGSYGATYFYNGGNTSLTLIGSGVGIGTTSPAEKLEVNGSIKLGSMKLENISAGGRIGFNRNTSNGAIYNSSYEAFQIQANGAGYLETQVYNSSGGYIGSMALTDDVKLGIGTNSPTYKLSVAGAISGSGFVTYTKSYGSLNSTGNAVAGITAAANGNGSSCGFTFTCFGHTGAYQRIVYSCYNSSGTWYAKKVIDEGTNQLDVAASANGSTITFTFRATSSNMSYTPRVKVEAEGQNINSTYA